ncbi:MAG TPA: nitronate monooxygenase [Candidatus Krumholzibacteria bacterium]|nr:nitronate monooxygenase [Candidatus Krumholzibacteria bacterium]HPD70884.1 nitronate monooxygenase [Candidatus Krumholzibacteria bacterium]HRY39416.1 nitronate monooxygenase [Candidatus Krumholzibacteria bacterium]
MDWSTNRLCRLLGTRLPIIQGGMIYMSGARLAAAVANAGGLGLLGSGSMRPDLFRDQLRKCRTLTDRPFGVNVPLLYSHSAEILEIALAEGVRLFVTSAGSPRRAIGRLKDRGCTVLHVVASPALAVKCEDAGCDAVVCEGFEAGGHNGREELTTLVLVPQCVAAVTIPVVAAGGIATGAQWAACMALGADGVQIGTRFAMTQESSGHAAFKARVAAAAFDETMLMMKKHIPVRLLRNRFTERVAELEARGASRDELVELLGQGRARRGMLEGDLDEGELEIGQVSGMIGDVPTVAEVVARLEAGYAEAAGRLG